MYVLYFLKAVKDRDKEGWKHSLLWLLLPFFIFPASTVLTNWKLSNPKQKKEKYLLMQIPFQKCLYYTLNSSFLHKQHIFWSLLFICPIVFLPCAPAAKSFPLTSGLFSEKITWYVMSRFHRWDCFSLAILCSSLLGEQEFSVCILVTSHGWRILFMI